MIIKARRWWVIVIYIIPCCERHRLTKIPLPGQDCALNNCPGTTGIISCGMELPSSEGSSWQTLIFDGHQHRQSCPEPGLSLSKEFNGNWSSCQSFGTAPFLNKSEFCLDSNTNRDTKLNILGFHSV